MLRLAGRADELNAAKQLAAAALSDGSGLSKFRELVEAQDGDVNFVDEPDRFQKAEYINTISATASGYLTSINAAEIGRAAVDLGSGRAKKGDAIDHSVGLVIHHKVGDEIVEGEALFTVHANQEADGAQAEARALAAHVIQPEHIDPLPLFYKTIENGR